MNEHGLNDNDFELVINGKKTFLYSLCNKNGFSVSLSNYGARIISVAVPYGDMDRVDVVAGYDSLPQYLNSTEAYHGATVGRYCNRIGGAQFELDGDIFQLTPNDGVNTLHGGTKGFHQAIWDVVEHQDNKITFHYLSEDMEEGYPGNLSVYVTYKLGDSNRIAITYQATTDKTTVINLTNHAYFNLNGAGSGSAMEHQLMIHASKYLPVDDFAIPTGKIDWVKGGAFDFSERTIIAESIQRFNLHGGYNHNFVLSPHEFDQPVAQLYGNKSGIQMNVFTDQPGLQLYTGDHFKGENVLRGGYPDGYRNYIALETQHFPDSVNHPSFPSTVLQPGEEFKSVTAYEFSKTT